MNRNKVEVRREGGRMVAESSEGEEEARKLAKWGVSDTKIFF